MFVRLVPAQYIIIRIRPAWCTADMTTASTKATSYAVGFTNGAIGTFASVFASKMCEKTAVSRLKWVGLFFKTYLEVRFPLLQVVGVGNHFRYFSDPTGSNTMTIPDWIGKIVFPDPIPGRNRPWPSWIGKVSEVISCNWAPGETGNSYR